MYLFNENIFYKNNPILTFSKYYKQIKVYTNIDSFSKINRYIIIKILILLSEI